VRVLLVELNEKANMNVVGNSEMETVNLETFGVMDPLQDLLSEGFLDEGNLEDIQAQARLLVTETNFPDQSMFILDLQLESLREKISRLKFYITDVDDLLPR
jgi:hypothetical protein